MELLDHTAVITGAQRIWSVGAEAGASKWMALRREVPGLARVRAPSATLGWLRHYYLSTTVSLSRCPAPVSIYGRRADVEVPDNVLLLGGGP